MDKKFSTYNEKCKFIHFRFRKDKDAKYLEFLNSLDNKTEFLRNAIDRAIEEGYLDGFVSNCGGMKLAELIDKNEYADEETRSINAGDDK